MTEWISLSILAALDGKVWEAVHIEPKYELEGSA